MSASKPSETDVGAWGDKAAQLKVLGLTLDSASQLCEKLNRAGGWRVRADLTASIEFARMSLSASQAYFDAQNWDMVLLELSDTMFALDEVSKAIQDGVSKP